jgi:alkylated DNA repair dioxygenase AlkB
MQDLFSQFPDSSFNLLPFDGEVNYHGKLMQQAEADLFFHGLMSDIPWENDQHIIFGKRIVTKRKMAWFGDEAFAYTYSQVTRIALPWTNTLRDLKSLVEKISGETYNSCLLNLYHVGEEGMGWHSDDEKELKKDGAIASLSFGAERKFQFKHRRTGDQVDVFLEHGSMLIMKGTVQTHWLHRLPPTKKVLKPRINLTFRTIVGIE